jgi:heme exporter protein D
MSGGYLHGGWGYVWAAYGWTTLVLFVYGASLVVRLRKAR